MPNQPPPSLLPGPVGVHTSGDLPAELADALLNAVTTVAVTVYAPA
ncbi:hypothetical protein [Kineosporia sp. NBRC 101731]|nr:hypothetical protein [Kineosporia sp. NBRC 101731]